MNKTTLSSTQTHPKAKTLFLCHFIILIPHELQNFIAPKASEGRAVLLPPEALEESRQATIDEEADFGELHEHLLLRRYGQLSRSPTPPDLHDHAQLRQVLDRSSPCEDDAIKERATLVLDLRASAHALQDETLSWHALTLEPIPSSRRSELSLSSSRSGHRKAPVCSQHRSSTALSSSPVRSVPVVEVIPKTFFFYFYYIIAVRIEFRLLKTKPNSR